MGQGVPGLIPLFLSSCFLTVVFFCGLTSLFHVIPWVSMLTTFFLSTATHQSEHSNKHSNSSMPTHWTPKHSWASDLTSQALLSAHSPGILVTPALPSRKSHLCWLGMWGGSEGINLLGWRWGLKLLLFTSPYHHAVVSFLEKLLMGTLYQSKEWWPPLYSSSHNAVTGRSGHEGGKLEPISQHSHDFRGMQWVPNVLFSSSTAKSDQGGQNSFKTWQLSQALHSHR